MDKHFKKQHGQANTWCANLWKQYFKTSSRHATNSAPERTLRCLC